MLYCVYLVHRIRLTGANKTGHSSIPGTNEKAAVAMWDVVPEDTQVLITHTPPAGICNMTSYWKEGRCAALKDKVGQIRPMLHICGIGKRAL